LPSGLSILPHVSVDRFLAHRAPALELASPGDLLRAPLAPQQSSHLVPILLAVLAVSSASPAPGNRVLLRLLCPVVAVMPGRIALELPADRRGRTAQNLRYPTQTVSATQTIRDGVSFTFGELVISHVRNPFLPDEDAHSLACSPTSITEGVALTMANRDA
jgi:hypothetical protein